MAAPQPAPSRARRHQLAGHAGHGLPAGAGPGAGDLAWRHFYWYLTNEGIAHPCQYLHLPPEIVPALQRVRRPRGHGDARRRTPHVQADRVPGLPIQAGPLPTEDTA